MMQRTATHCNTMQHAYEDFVAHEPCDFDRVYITWTQRTATLCNTLQHTTALIQRLRCSRTMCIWFGRYYMMRCAGIMQRTASHCNTLQHTYEDCVAHESYAFHRVHLTWIHRTATLCNTPPHTHGDCATHYPPHTETVLRTVHVHLTYNKTKSPTNTGVFCQRALQTVHLHLTLYLREPSRCERRDIQTLCISSKEP